MERHTFLFSTVNTNKQQTVTQRNHGYVNEMKKIYKKQITQSNCSVNSITDMELVGLFAGFSTLHFVVAVVVVLTFVFKKEIALQDT